MELMYDHDVVSHMYQTSLFSLLLCVSLVDAGSVSVRPPVDLVNVQFGEPCVSVVSCSFGFHAAQDRDLATSRGGLSEALKVVPPDRRSSGTMTAATARLQRAV